MHYDVTSLILDVWPYHTVRQTDVVSLLYCLLVLGLSICLLPEMPG